MADWNPTDRWNFTPEELSQAMTPQQASDRHLRAQRRLSDAASRGTVPRSLQREWHLSNQLLAESLRKHRAAMKEYGEWDSFGDDLARSASENIPRYAKGSLSSWPSLIMDMLPQSNDWINSLQRHWAPLAPLAKRVRNPGEDLSGDALRYQIGTKNLAGVLGEMTADPLEIGKPLKAMAAMTTLAKAGRKADDIAEALAKTAKPTTSGVESAGAKVAEASRRSTIRGAQRKAFPDIYAPPQQIAKYVENTKVAPENPMMARLFGVTRADLAEMADLPPTASGVIPGAAAKPRGAESAELVMKPANTRRLINLLDAAREHAPRLFEGMKGWYEMDPAYHRILELVGGNEREAMRLYTQFNHFTGFSSPSSDVITELRRGTAANYLAEQGRFADFERFGGAPEAMRRQAGLPEDILSFPGHPYHSTAQAPAMRSFLDTGEAQLKSPKVPMYIQASEAYPIGKQKDILVGDAHYSRGVGLADTRNWLPGNKVPGASVSTAELQAIAPWWREEVAAQAGLQAVPAQAVQWGLLSDATGVQTLIGAPKLEILSGLAEETAKRLKISPEEARDRILLARAQAGYADPKLLGLLVPPAVVATMMAGIDDE